MQNFFKSSAVPVFVLTAIVSGCAFFSDFSKQDVQDQIDIAKEYFEAAVRLEADKEQSEDFQKAGNSLKEAGFHFSMGRRKAAVASATESIRASRKILGGFYIETIARLAEKTRAELEKKSGGDPDNPMTAYIPRVEGVVEYAQKISVEPHTVELGKVLADLDEVLQIVQIVRSNQSETLSSDISFQAGEYTLAEQGGEIIDKMFTNILENVRQTYPDKTVTLNIRVVGYTDQLNFGPGTELVKNLVKGAEAQVPEKDPELRKFLNQRLSQLRAESIGKYVADLIGKKAWDGKMRLDTMGRGEQIPVHVAAPYPVSDARRRICKIHVHITTP